MATQIEEQPKAVAHDRFGERWDPGDRRVSVDLDDLTRLRGALAQFLSS
jgi:hypothetical protein